MRHGGVSRPRCRLCVPVDCVRGEGGHADRDVFGAVGSRGAVTQVAYFAARGEEFEWKLYDYDRPPDLGGRLLAAGFAAAGEESLMVTEVSSVPTQVDLPPGVRLLRVTDEAGVDLLADVHQQVFGTDSSRLRRSVLAQLRDHPDAVAMVVALAGDQPICSARIEFLPGSSFASLWGGGTLPGWRGRGIYRALIAYRARLAAARGYRYLYVDASPDSQPILARLGFSRLAVTTPYVWVPGRAGDLTTG